GRDRHDLGVTALDDGDRDQSREQRGRRERQQPHDDRRAQVCSSCARTASPSSSSCSGVILDGAPDIGSRPAWFFGNAITSRRFGSPASTIVIRSMPSAIPPIGGAPIASASSRKPNFERCSASDIPSSSNTFAWISGSWILKLPPPISFPFTIRSYACAS